MCHGGKESHQPPGLCWAACCQQGEGGDPAPLLSTSEDMSGVLAPQDKRDMDLLEPVQ